MRCEFTRSLLVFSLIGSLVVLFTAAPAPTAAAISRLEVGGSYSDLDSGFDEWTSQYLTAESELGLRSGLYGSISHTDWFEEDDVDLLGGIYGPLAPRLDGRLEVGGSPTHEVSPKWSTQGQLSYNIVPRLDVIGGWSYFDYDEGDEAHEGLGALRYTEGPYWIQAGYVPGWVEDHGPSDSVEVRGGFYQSRNRRIGASLLWGESITEVAAGDVETTDVTAFTLFGEFPLSPRYSLTYQASWEDVEDFYDRWGLQLGFAWSAAGVR